MEKLKTIYGSVDLSVLSEQVSRSLSKNFKTLGQTYKLINPHEVESKDSSDLILKDLIVNILKRLPE